MTAQPSVCGPLVLARQSAAIDREAQVVSTRNPVLIGAVPGQIVLANMRVVLGVREGVAGVSFEPVWALPADPLHSDKQSVRVIALAAQLPAGDIHTPHITDQKERRARRLWCDAILDSARKRLMIEPDDPDVRRLWAEYRRRAKAVRKRLR